MRSDSTRLFRCFLPAKRLALKQNLTDGITVKPMVHATDKSFRGNTVQIWLAHVVSNKQFLMCEQCRTCPGLGVLAAVRYFCCCKHHLLGSPVLQVGRAQSCKIGEHHLMRKWYPVEEYKFYSFVCMEHLSSTFKKYISSVSDMDNDDDDDNKNVSAAGPCWAMQQSIQVENMVCERGLSSPATPAHVVLFSAEFGRAAACFWFAGLIWGCSAARFVPKITVQNGFNTICNDLNTGFGAEIKVPARSAASSVQWQIGTYLSLTYALLTYSLLFACRPHWHRVWTHVQCLLDWPQKQLQSGFLLKKIR